MSCWSNAIYKYNIYIYIYIYIYISSNCADSMDSLLSLSLSISLSLSLSLSLVISFYRPLPSNCYLWGTASRICSKQHTAFLCTSHVFFFYKCSVKVHVVQPYNSIDIATTWKDSRFILSQLDFQAVDNLSIAVHAFPMCILASLSVDEILLLRYVKWFTNFRGSFNVEMVPSCLKHAVFDDL